MFLNFTLQGNRLILNNPDELNKTDDIKFIQVQVNVCSKAFAKNDVLVSVFKSASYNIMEQVILEGTYSDFKRTGFIPAKVFEHGGVIQMLLYRNTISGPDAQVSTNTFEFYIDPKRYVPITTPTMWEHMANEVSSIKSTLADGVDYEDVHNKPKIEGVTLIGDKTYDQLNLAGLTNIEIEAMLS